MKVKDNSRLMNLQCECGFVMYVNNVSRGQVWCENDKCEQYRVKYLAPEETYIELTKEKQ